MQKRDALIVSAATLANAAPIQWQNFLQALAVYTEVHRDNVIKSPLPELPVNQGRAQSLSTLRDLLGTCVAEADKIRKK